MKIKYRITWLFTLVVSSILLMVCVSIYYFSDLNRQNDFQKRLRNRALTTVSLLLEVEGIDNNLLRRIDESTFISVQDKSVAIYNEFNKILYSYTDSAVVPINVDSAILNRHKKNGEYSYTEGLREIIVIDYHSKGKKYTLVAAAYDRDGLTRLSQLRFILMVSFFSGILITIFSGLIFSSNIVSSIKKITKEVKEISSQNLSRRIKLYEPKDELNELSATFNDLLTRLEESFEIQRRFISNASHELSTPLTSISSQLEITLQNERNVDEYKSVIHSVYEDVQNLTRLTRGLLEIAKASGTSAGMELTPVRVDELLMKLPADLRKTNKQFQVEMHFETFPENEDNLLVFGNPDLLYSAIKNVVLNACKYGADHTANISLSFSAGHLSVIVKDNGPGIDEEEKKMIFQPFYRSQSVWDIQGFGLGLSLALKIISLHKGTIELTDTSANGTTISIHFPTQKIIL